jgi:DUF971 family protein
MPQAIRRLPTGIELVWDADHVELLPSRALRLACPCAGCVEEMSGRMILDPATVPDDVHADAVELVGGYGLRIRWSDAHATGIYTFAMLRQWPG